jgi:hypothetical protein
MTLKTNFRQQRLWMLSNTPDGMELPAAKRRELTAALADLLLQFAGEVSKMENTPEHGGSDGYDEPHKNHA